MSKIDKVIYTGKTRTTGGREGYTKSDDGRLDVKLSPPGSNGPGTNPEQMFAAGWSACFIGAMGRAAKELNVTVPADVAVDAEVDLGSGEGGFFLQARLAVSLPGLSRETAQAVVEAANKICPYSQMAHGNIDATLTVSV
ncbi:organic hydroperoxide resistance protein [Bordetella sp. N]|uniref:organic hydroperoxide resistance protein n=1 Tax=Bordetella sp. N TaxID=1746199 RepID=UPI00070ECF73|nr:organic hydroperoxide resistance protein [Bordetella sp. N]ALM84305.1 peroxiredoxin [Bordetella sp. N]